MTRELAELLSVLHEHHVSEVAMESTSVYVSTTDGKSYREAIRLLSVGVTDLEELIRKIHRRTINKWGRESILSALDGVVTKTDTDIIGQLYGEVSLNVRHRDMCQEKNDSHVREAFPRRICQPEDHSRREGTIGNRHYSRSGNRHGDFRDTGTSCLMVGFKPRNDESAGKIKGRRITLRNEYPRKTLVECAWAASRKRNCFYSRLSYTQTAVRRKNKMKVRVAVARKIHVAVWHILKENVPYRELLDIAVA